MSGFQARRLLDCLPPQALLVADAGFIGFDFWRTLDAHRHAFLIRLSSVCHFYADFQVDADFKEGIAWLWPNDQRHLPPLQVRIIRLAAKNPRHDVWLATNILDSARFSHGPKPDTHGPKPDTHVFLDRKDGRLVFRFWFSGSPPGDHKLGLTMSRAFVLNVGVPENEPVM